MNADISKTLSQVQLNSEQQADLCRWVELERQNRELITHLHNRTLVGHEVSLRLDLVWRDKAMVAERLTASLASQLIG